MQSRKEYGWTRRGVAQVMRRTERVGLKEASMRKKGDPSSGVSRVETSRIVAGVSRVKPSRIVARTSLERRRIRGENVMKKGSGRRSVASEAVAEHLTMSIGEAPRGSRRRTLPGGLDPA